MTARIRVAMLLLLLGPVPVTLHGQPSLLSVTAPHWGDTREQVTAAYGRPAFDDGRFLLYRTDMDYGRTEVRFEFQDNTLIRVIIGIEPDPRTRDFVVRDVTTLLRARPGIREVMGGTLYTWDNGYSYAQYGPVPAGDPRDWNTLAFSDRRIVRM